MAGPTEQDKLSEDWGLDENLPLTGTTPSAPEKTDDAMSAEWTAMLEGDGKLAPPGGADRVLNQDEIDSLLGFDPNAGGSVELLQHGIEDGAVSRHRAPTIM